jgi:ADP-heptose:LPS heptosyltransferase
MKKVLIISSNRLGDCILSTGLNNFFKKKSEDYKIFFVCGPVPGEFFKYCRNIDKLIVIRKKKFSLHWINLWQEVFLNYWDYVIDLRGSIISFLLVAKNRKIFKSRMHIHKVEEISSLLSKKNLHPNINFNHKISLTKEYVERITELAKKKDLILIAPSSNWIGKTWPINNFSKLLFKLNENQIFSKSIFVILGPQNEKKIMINLLNEKSLPIFDLVGKVSLPEIFLIMKKSKLFIGNDSGLMHLSALANIPTIGLFGPSDSRKYHPWGIKTLAIKSPKSPEQLMGYKEFNSKKVNSLMGDLSVKSVLQEIINFYKTYV